VNRIRILAAIVLLATASAVFGQALVNFIRAVNDGDANTVAALLAKGVDPDSADPDGNTALMLAARLGHRNVVQVLVGRANVARMSAHGDTALNLAALGGHLEIVKILVDHGGQVAPTTGWSPLHYAAFENHAEVIKYLITKGAQKDALAPNGYTALMLAARGGHLEAVRTLLYEDADAGVRGPKGETAMSIAAAKGNEELVKLLQRSGAGG